MGMIFKIAAGVLIAFLVFWNLILDSAQDERDEIRRVMMEANNSKSNQIDSIHRTQIGVRGLIESYYFYNKKLPEFYSDMRCWKCDQKKGLDIFMRNQRVYFLNKSGGYYAIKFSRPVNGDKPNFSCIYNVEKWKENKFLKECYYVSKQVKAPDYKLSFSCDAPRSGGEDLICQSDRLIKSEQELEKVYFSALGRATPKISELIEDQQKQFYRQRLIDCVDKAYMTSKKRTECIERSNAERVLKF